MTEAARAAGRTQLVMLPSEWEALVRRHLAGADLTSFSQEVLDRAGEAGTADELNQWLQLAMNIWNTTPQPDRGGKTAYELSRRPVG